MRYFLGVDWGDETDTVHVLDEAGETRATSTVRHTVEARAEWGRHLDTWRAEGVEVWAAIERPDGLIVEFLLDHGVVVYPVNPKASERARDRFRQSGAKSDGFDAYALAAFLRSDGAQWQPLHPHSPEAQELKLLTEDYQRLVRQRTRLVNQLIATLKAYYPEAITLWPDLARAIARDFLRRWPTREAAATSTSRAWASFVQAHAMPRDRAAAVRAALRAPALPVPAHVTRAKSRLVTTLVAQLDVVVDATSTYQAEIERFFAALPAAEWARSLPVGHGVTMATVWAQLGDAPDRWRSFRHLQAHAGVVPVTRQSGRARTVQFRYGCDQALRYAIDQFAWLSLHASEWARAYYRDQRGRGHRHHRALRALAAKWLKIMFVLREHGVSYDETHHLATMARQRLRAA